MPDGQRANGQRGAKSVVAERSKGLVWRAKAGVGKRGTGPSWTQMTLMWGIGLVHVGNSKDGLVGGLGTMRNDACE